MNTSRYNKSNSAVSGSFLRFWRKHLVLCNCVAVIIAIPLLGWISLLFVDLWTHHGATTVVPNVKSMTYENAVKVIEESDLKAVISDSIYDLTRQPGEVVDIFPKAGAVVKPDREIYLTIVSFSPQQIILDVPVVDQSVKSAIAYLKAQGIKTIRIVRVPSQFPDLVIAMKYNGKSLGMGSRIPVTATITLEVGQVETPVYDEGESLDDAIDAVMDAEEQEANSTPLDIPMAPVDEPDTQTEPEQ